MLSESDNLIRKEVLKEFGVPIMLAAQGDIEKAHYMVAIICTLISQEYLAFTEKKVTK